MFFGFFWGLWVAWVQSLALCLMSGFAAKGMCAVGTRIYTFVMGPREHALHFGWSLFGKLSFYSAVDMSDCTTESSRIRARLSHADDARCLPISLLELHRTC